MNGCGLFSAWLSSSPSLSLRFSYSYRPVVVHLYLCIDSWAAVTRVCASYPSPLRTPVLALIPFYQLTLRLFTDQGSMEQLSLKGYFHDVSSLPSVWETKYFLSIYKICVQPPHPNTYLHIWCTGVSSRPFLKYCLCQSKTIFVLSSLCTGSHPCLVTTLLGNVCTFMCLATLGASSVSLVPCCQRNICLMAVRNNILTLCLTRIKYSVRYDCPACADVPIQHIGSTKERKCLLFTSRSVSSWKYAIQYLTWHFANSFIVIKLLYVLLFFSFFC